MFKWLNRIFSTPDVLNYVVPDLSVDPETDSWHPGNPESYTADGLLPDLSDEDVRQVHLLKPEVHEQVDARVHLDHDGDEGI